MIGYGSKGPQTLHAGFLDAPRRLAPFVWPFDRWGAMAGFRPFGNDNLGQNSRIPWPLGGQDGGERS